MSKRSLSLGGSRRGGILGEAAWEAKKSAGGEKCRKRLLTPSSYIDTFLRAFCPSASRVRAWCTANVNQSAGRLLLLTRARLAFLFRVSFASDTRRSGREIGHRWNFNVRCPPRRSSRSPPLFPILVLAFASSFFQVHSRVHSECECIKRRASAKQDAIDEPQNFSKLQKLGGRYAVIINHYF